jgi:hypothetical protein
MTGAFGICKAVLRLAVLPFRGKLQRMRYAQVSRAAQDFHGRKGLKLHLGCGSKNLPGYVNIDGYPGAKADLYLDFKQIGAAFSEGSVAEALMIHSISYLNLWEARELFRELHRLMEKGGLLIIESPDVSKCARKMLEAGTAKVFNPEYLEGVRGFYAFGLDHMSSKSSYTPYAFGWSDWHLRQELLEAGFRDVSITEPQTHEKGWRDLRVEARK